MHKLRLYAIEGNLLDSFLRRFKGDFRRFMSLTIKALRHLRKTQMTQYLVEMHKKDGEGLWIITKVKNNSHHRATEPLKC